MNNLHRRRMQENPFPSTDYIRIVTSDGLSFNTNIKTKSGKVWVYNNQDDTYKRLSCVDGKTYIINGIKTDTGGSDIKIYGVRQIANTGKLSIFDASKSLSFSAFYDYLYGGTMELIDISNCNDITYASLKGYGSSESDTWNQTKAKKIVVSGCTNIGTLFAQGVNSSSKIIGLEDCRKLRRLTLLTTNPCNEKEEYLNTIDFSGYNELKDIYFYKVLYLEAIRFPSVLVTLQLKGCTSITSLDNLPAGLTTLNCSNCTGISSLDNLPSNLITLYCGGTSITSLDNLPAGLTTLNCSNCTGISSLDNLPSNLITLYCGGTSIMHLDNLPSGLTTLDCSKCISVTTLDNLPAGLTSLGCEALNLSKADFSNTIIETINAYGLKVQDGIFAPPITLKSFSAGNNKIKQGDFSQCVNLGTFGAYGTQWMVGKLLLPPSIKTLLLGTSWGTWVYPMPDLTACVSLTSIDCQNCTNIPRLDQQAFIDSLPTFTDGSTRKINLKNTGVVAETVSAIQAKGWTVQV